MESIQNMYKESLFEAISKVEVVLWVGAGLSLYAGLPSGAGLREILYEGLTPLEKEEVGKNLDLSHLADEICTLKGNKNYIIQTLKDTFRRDFLSTETHKIISQIPHFRNIITTNYDSLFESVYGSGKLNVIFSDNHTPYIDAKKVNLFKIHGDLSNPDSIIITESDYNNFFSKDTEQNTIWSVIKEIIATKSILFIGYGLEDTNIQVIFNKIRNKIGENGKECYFVAPNISTAKSIKLNKVNIHPISLTGEKLFEELIEYLKKNIKKNFEDKYISSDIYSEFIGNFGLKSEIEVNSSIGKNIVKNLTGIEGKDTKINMTFSVSSSSEEIHKLDALINKGDISGEINIDRESLTAFNININGINFRDIDDVKNLKIVPQPFFDKQVDIIFENGKEFNDVEIKIFSLSQIDTKLRVITQLYGNELEIVTSPSINDEAEALFTYTISEQIDNISKQILFFELVKCFSEGQYFSIYTGKKRVFDSKRIFKRQSLEGLNPIYKKNNAYLTYFESLKKIERLGKLRFTNINIEDVTFENYKLLLIVIAKFENNFIEEINPKISLNPECFDYTEHKEDFNLCSTNNSEDIVVHNQTFKMGEITIQISDAFISNYEEIINDRTISPIVESHSKRAIITFNN